MASFLYSSPYSYCSSNYRDSNSCLSFSLLKEISPLRARKGDNYCYRDSWKSNNYVHIEIKINERSKEIRAKIKQRSLWAITLQEAIEKNPILLSHYWKMKNFTIVHIIIYRNLNIFCFRSDSIFIIFFSLNKLFRSSFYPKHLSLINDML